MAAKIQNGSRKITIIREMQLIIWLYRCLFQLICLMVLQSLIHDQSRTTQNMSVKIQNGHQNTIIPDMHLFSFKYRYFFSSLVLEDISFFNCQLRAKWILISNPKWPLKSKMATRINLIQYILPKHLFHLAFLNQPT